ncbi:SpaH/EbpB family LPXTG-anchored major pilin [uncultured Subdoligranulum sp.]|uniref:SpaH/EbpB family LPXTG-anchored major pilin n=1 Tax=uncultured Subdoligranulum sp. TaxID=512298 RepID=UPI0026012E58|nr:SpaH/EbpB family LPXTG-anchored major pilin [uncultured Subdoligranulum sp.]
MKKKLQQWAALCLTLALAFCLALPVWADEPTTYDISVGQTGTIQVNGIQESADTTVTVNVYQLMTVKFDTTNQQPEEPLYTWVSGVAQWLNTNTNETYKAYINASDNSVTEAFSAPANDADGTKAAEIAAFYDALAAAIRSTSSPLIETPTKSVRATNGSCTISDLEMGNYLVLIEGGMKVYRPSAVNLVPEWKKTVESPETWGWVLETANVELKSSEPALTKTVSDTQVAIGDTVTYTLVADVPHFPDNALNKGYCISDELPAGMTFGSITSVEGYTGNNPNVSLGGTTLTENSDYKDATRPVTGTTPAFTLSFTNLKNTANERYTKIKVTYTATVNRNITVIGSKSTALTNNINNAFLDYNNDPYGSATSWQTKTATATVYSYGIKVNKVDDKGQALSGAKFTLSTDQEGKAKIQFDKTSDGTYLKTASGVTEIDVDSSGKLTLSGLDVGTYYLTETKAPGGYVKLTNPVVITITDAAPNGLVDDGTSGDAGTDGADGYYELNVENSQGFTLPSTGGMGTVLFTTIGIVLMGGGLVLLLLYLRRRNRAE